MSGSGLFFGHSRLRSIFCIRASFAKYYDYTGLRSVGEFSLGRVHCQSDG